MKKFFLALLLILLTATLAFFINGCNQTGDAVGNLKLQVTDKPLELNITGAFITISNIEVHKALKNESEDATTENSWFIVINETKTFDLIELKNQKIELGTRLMGVGKYTQVRLAIIDAKIKINGTEYNLTVPSGKIKLIKGFSIEENKTTILALDFELNESIHEVGNSLNTRYSFEPVIKIIQE